MTRSNYLKQAVLYILIWSILINPIHPQLTFLIHSSLFLVRAKRKRKTVLKQNRSCFHCIYTKQCEIKDIKFSQMRTKIIALGWYWVNMILWCQINPEIHCSPAGPSMHNVQVKTTNLLYKSVKASWKWTSFGSFIVQFLLITCVRTNIFFL